MTHSQLPRIRSKLRSGLIRLLGRKVEGIYLFGSQARGDADETSDIDVLVVLNIDFDYFEMVESTGALAAKLSLDYDTVISLTFIKKVDYIKQYSPFVLNVRKEGIPV
jgi:uncharacterized protein